MNRVFRCHARGQWLLVGLKNNALHWDHPIPQKTGAQKKPDLRCFITPTNSLYLPQTSTIQLVICVFPERDLASLTDCSPIEFSLSSHEEIPEDETMREGHTPL